MTPSPSKVLTLTVGLPRSGKSSWARETGFPIVGGDALRQAMTGGAWFPPVEPMIWGVARMMARALFFSGSQNVVVDATHLTPQHRAYWRPTSDCPWRVELALFDTPVDVCIERARKTNKEYLIEPIRLLDRCKVWPVEGEDIFLSIPRDGHEPELFETRRGCIG